MAATEITVDVRVTPSVELEHQQMVHHLFKPGGAILASLTADKCELLHAAVGICTEAGELLDAVKKHVFYNKELDLANVVEELGDSEFYHQALRARVDISREVALLDNLVKLLKGEKARYKLGYSDQAAIDRVDKVPTVDSVNPHTDLPIN